MEVEQVLAEVLPEGVDPQAFLQALEAAGFAIQPIAPEEPPMEEAPAGGRDPRLELAERLAPQFEV